MLTTEKQPSTALYLDKDIGCDAVVAVVSRDTDDVMLSEAQRLSYFPASSFVSLSWHNNIGISVFDRLEKGGSWKGTNENVQISGSQSQPTVSWSVRGGRGGMMCFTVSVAQTLFDFDVTTIKNQRSWRHLEVAWQNLQSLCRQRRWVQSCCRCLLESRTWADCDGQAVVHRAVAQFEVGFLR